MTNQRMLFPDPATQIGNHQFPNVKRQEELTFSMDPQERSGRHPVIEYVASKEPRGRSLMLGLACIVLICGRVWRRKPFVNVLFYLCPWVEDLVSTTDAIQEDHKHFTSSTSDFTSTTPRFTSIMSFDICCITMLVLSAPMWTSV